MVDVLVDASYLVALGYPRDRNHHAARQFAANTADRLWIPDVVLPEVFYNLRRVGGTRAALLFGERLYANAAPLLPLAQPDFKRALAIMRQYVDADLDFVDCCLTALAERLNITHICTFDRRDFSMIVPNHAAYFQLLP